MTSIESPRACAAKHEAPADWSLWVQHLQGVVVEAGTRDTATLNSKADPLHPGGIYGELAPRLADDAVAPRATTGV